MDTNNKSENKKYSEVYNQHRIRYDNLFNSFLENIDFIEKCDLVDIGCGTGRYTRLFANENFSSVYGVDESLDMLNEAKKLDSISNYVRGNINALPFADNSFDTAVMSQVIQWVPKIDRQSAFIEINRILKRNGVFLINTLSHEQLGDLILMKHFPEIYQIEVNRFPDIFELERLLKNANFTIDFVKEIKETRKYDIDELVNFVCDKATSALRIYASDVGENIFKTKIEDYRTELKKTYSNNYICEYHNYTLIKCIVSD